jgi:ribulose-phosphate 3-epimerase
MELIPAVLKNDVVQAQIVMAELRKAGLIVSRVQVDFVDGKYNTNLTFRPSEFDITQYYPVKFDAHLMVVEDNVLTWSMVAEKVGYERVFVQLESISHPEEYEYLALDVHSPVTALKAEWLAKLKGVLILGVEPGFGGQEMSEGVLEKVTRIKEIRNEGKFGFKIGVDGGVRANDVNALEEAGADEVVVGAGRYLKEFVLK